MDFKTFIIRQRTWSEQTFGKGKRTEGVLKHIEKEIAEIRANPNDIKEYIDVMILIMDVTWRAGFTPEQIEEALYNKQTENFFRKWPPPNEADQDAPIEHIK